MPPLPSTFGSPLLAIAVIVGCVEVAADDDIKFPTQTAILVVSITDQAGKPIAGATVKPYGCRCLQEPGTGWGWPISNVGKPKEATTDEQGNASVSYPVKFGSDPDWMTTSEISAMVAHPEFIGQQLHVDPRGGKTQLTLKPGCQLTFSAVDETGSPIEFGIVMAGPGRTAKWIKDETGVKRSRAIPDGTWQTMLVSPREDGTHLFSGVRPLRLRDGQSVNVRNLRLRPGLRLRGQLSEDVPRPISNGNIIAHCLPKPAGRTWGADDPSISWETATDIHQDGTFEFPSLPRSGLLQLITVCDGYVGTNTDVPEQNPVFRQGLFLQLDQRDEDEVVTVPMEPTGTVNVKVLRPDGQPLADAQVAMCPNHFLHLCGSTILGESWESIEEILVQLDPDHELPTPDFTRTRYTAKTNHEGIATIADLPIGQTESIYVYHDQFVIPSFRGGNDRRVSVAVKDANPVDVVIKTVSVQTATGERAAITAAGEFADAAKRAAEAIGDLIGK